MAPMNSSVERVPRERNGGVARAGDDCSTGSSIATKALTIPYAHAVFGVGAGIALSSSSGRLRTRHVVDLYG